MHDQGVEVRPLFGREDPGDSRRGERIRAQPVDGLGRERHESAGGDVIGGEGEPGGVGLDDGHVGGVVSG